MLLLLSLKSNLKKSFILIIDSQINFGYVRIQKYIYIFFFFFFNYSPYSPVKDFMLAIIPRLILFYLVLLSMHRSVCPQLKEKWLLVSLHQNPRVSQQISSLVVLMSRLSVYGVQSHQLLSKIFKDWL